MNVLYHHRTLGDGAEGIHVSSIVASLRALGHDVRVAALIGEPTSARTMRVRALTALRRRMPRAAYELLEIGYGVVGYRTLMRQMATWQPDFIYERYTLFNRAGMIAASKAGVPHVLEFNAPLAWERANYENLHLKRLARSVERTICRRANVVIVVSTPLKEYLVAEGVAPDRIVVMPNGADPDHFHPDHVARTAMRQRYRISDDTVVVGFSGILRPWHGVALLLNAIAMATRRNCALHALIVGDGPDLPLLTELTSRLGLGGSVTFTGRVLHDQMPEYVAAFDIGVSPRATFYASPMKIPEYMAAGVAVVAPRTANLRDLINDGVDGELFEPENVDDLSCVIQRLSTDHTRRQRLGTAARDTIVTRRTWRHNARKIVELAAAARA